MTEQQTNETQIQTQEDPARTLLHNRISGWTRQARYRASKIPAAILEASYADVIQIYEFYNYKCAICFEDAASPTLLWPLKQCPIFVPANIIPCCDKCRKERKTSNIVEFKTSERFENSCIVREAFKRPGADKMKVYCKRRYEV